MAGRGGYNVGSGVVGCTSCGDGIPDTILVRHTVVQAKSRTRCMFILDDGERCGKNTQYKCDVRRVRLCNSLQLFPEPSECAFHGVAYYRSNLNAAKRMRRYGEKIRQCRYESARLFLVRPLCGTFNICYFRISLSLYVPAVYCMVLSRFIAKKIFFCIHRNGREQSMSKYEHQFLGYTNVIPIICLCAEYILFIFWVRGEFKPRAASAYKNAAMHRGGFRGEI